MIDVLKIKVGDEVTVRAKVIQVRDYRSHRYPFSVETPSESRICISSVDIATHTPKPREFNPGDRVYEIGFDSGFSVVHVSDEMAWISDGRGWNKIARILHLRHADESE